MSDGRVLVTGASGFVGRAVVTALVQQRVPVTAAIRSDATFHDNVRIARVGSLGGDTDWVAALKDCRVVVHCAARVHVMHESAVDPLNAFRVANVDGSMRLARQAAAAGVRRMVFVSSIKVMGEETTLGSPFTERDAPAPVGPYGVSKWEAERHLKRIAADCGLELVVIRPPLVYGPGVKANFLSMTRWIERGIPLPFGSLTKNRRTLVALDNLVDLMLACTTHPAAAGETFLAGDGDDLSTADLLRRTAAALGVRPRLLPVPPELMALAATIGGRSALWQRLGGTLQASIAHATRILGWRPPLTVDEGLRRAVVGLGARRGAR